MAGVAAGLLHARRRVHSVAEKCNLHLDYAELTDDHGSAMQRCAEIGAAAEVANIGVGERVEFCKRVKAGAHAVSVPNADREWPGNNDLVADIFVDGAKLRHDRSGDIGDKAVKEVEEAGLAEAFSDDGRGFHIDEQQCAFLNTGPTIAASGEIEQHALAEQAVHAIEQVEAQAQDEREDHAAGLDQGLALSEGPQEPGADSQADKDCNEIPQRAQREIQQERYPADERAERPAKDNKLEQDGHGGNQSARHGTADAAENDVVRQLEPA